MSWGFLVEGLSAGLLGVVVAVADLMTIPQLLIIIIIPTLSMILFITTTSDGHTGNLQAAVAVTAAKVPAPSSHPSLASLVSP